MIVDYQVMSFINISKAFTMLIFITVNMRLFLLFTSKKFIKKNGGKICEGLSNICIILFIFCFFKFFGYLYDAVFSVKIHNAIKAKVDYSMQDERIYIE